MFVSPRLLCLTLIRMLKRFARPTPPIGDKATAVTYSSALAWRNKTSNLARPITNGY